LGLNQVDKDFKVIYLHGKRFYPNPLQNVPRLAAGSFVDKNLSCVI